MCVNKKIAFIWGIVICTMCFGSFRVSAANPDDDFTYQSLTNLGPCASSRVLLMNNDTNPTCPIQGQGYHDTSNTVAVGQTYWWHDDTPVTEEIQKGWSVDTDVNLLPGIRHILYQKNGNGNAPVKLWELVNCRAGSAAVKYPAAWGAPSYNYLPWSSTSRPINSEYCTGAIPDVWDDSLEIGDNSNGVRQVSTIIMRATADAAIYSPVYEDGISEIYFDLVNQRTVSRNSHIAVEVKTEFGITSDEQSSSASQNEWIRVPCDVFKITNGICAVDAENDGKKELRIAVATGLKSSFYRIRVRVNIRDFVQFRIIRTDVNSSLGVNSSTKETLLDYGDLFLVDNIIVAYPNPKAVLYPTGIDSEGTGFARIGRVGAFTEPFLSKGLDTAKPRMTYSAETNGLPQFIDWKASVTNSDFVWRWCYLNQAYGPWTTNKMTVAGNGSELVGTDPITITNRIGDIEYYYVADVAGSQYKFFDFANDTQIQLPASEGASARVRYPDTTVEGMTNYWSRIREGISPWQEMHLEAYVITNADSVLVATNNWTMELISDHTWRGFVNTPTNYAGKTVHIRFVGKNMWESNGVAPSVDSKIWYFPKGEITEIPMGGVASVEIEGEEQDVVLDATSGYLMFEFNDQSGAFTMNRAEYQDFNKWTPAVGQEENRYIGDYVNTSYVGRAKQEYTLDVGNWPMSRSTSAYWWENFDSMAGNKDYPFDVPFGLNKMTPNGWVASNGMFINGMFSATTNKTTIGMALQLQGRGLGTMSLIDPADEPKGIGTVSFSARLAQYLEFGDFYYYVDGTAKKNYAISAKAAMTNHRKKFSDVSTGSPSLSLVAYYRPGQGCYEFRVTRVSTASVTDLWAKNGKMEAAIYKWSKAVDPATGEIGWVSKKLKSTVYSDAEANYLVPNNSGTNVIDNANWSSIYFAAYTSGGSTYLEGAVAVKPCTTVYAYDDIKANANKMNVVSFTDSDAPLTKGAYGVCACECPGAFGNVHIHEVTGTGPYKNSSTGVFSTGKFKSCPEGDIDTEGSWSWISKTISDEDWGSASANRIVRWDVNDKNPLGGTYRYGLRAAPVSQKLYLSTAPIGDSKNWTDTGLDLTLTSYISTNVVFSPRTTTPANVQISVGGNQGSPRTDVAIDDIQLSQWAGDSSQTSDLGSMTKWAFTDAWVAGTTNDVYQGAGSKAEDPTAFVTPCGYYVKQLNDTEFIYVFTNTTAGALGNYATFVPKYDMIVKELFVLGAGGGGGPGGGGGGGGNAIWVTNDVEYAAGEEGITVYVANGGSGGTARYSNNAITPSAPGNGGTSYVRLKNPLKLSETQQYQGYGGYYGGFFRDGYDKGNGSTSGGGAGGGSARKNATRAAGREIYAAGFGGAAMDGAPGGGGGGGLRGIAPGTGSSYGAGNASKPTSVIYPGSNGADGIGDGYGGKGGDGFPLSALGESDVRYAIGELLGDNNAWLGGGGGGGSGRNLAEFVSTWGAGAYTPGVGGQWSGGAGGLYTAGSYDSYTPAMGAAGKPFTGGGGGGGAFVEPWKSGNNNKSHYITGGGAGGGGLVVMHVKIKDRFVMLQPMRGYENDPMSIRTLFLNGISLLSFSWKDAHSNAVLKVQIATNGVDATNIRSISESLNNGWSDYDKIEFSKVEDARRAQGSTNILIGLRAPISGIVRLLVDPSIVATARKGATNELDSMYGTVIVTGMKVFDEPELDDRSWWGWNIMPTYKLEWSSLYDPVTLGPGRSCGLNFTGRLPGGWTVDDMNSDSRKNDPENPHFAVKTQDDFTIAEFDKHDPFVQTPRFTNRIGAVMFKARVTETNLTSSGWVTISACSNPGEEDDAKWDVLTNIEVTASTTVFEPFLWRIPTSQSDYQALRLTTWGAAEGRQNQEESGQPFGANGTKNPAPIQRVLIDEVVVTQPMAPKVALKNAYAFRKGTRDNKQVLNIDSPDQQPILNETFGMQVQVVPAGMEDELDVDSIKVYMAWYAGDQPWGYKNWKDEKYATKKVELKRADEWSVNNLVYRSHPDDAGAFIPPQQAGEYGYQIVQYHIWAEYKNKNGIEQDPHELSKTDWAMPAWYFGITDFNKVNTDFSAYTVLDTISPKRAWINEINTFDGNTLDDKCQFVEFAVPQGFDMTGWSVQCIKNDDKYDAKSVARFGVGGVVAHKSANATNSYAFIALQSPNTKAANKYSDVNDGTWSQTAFENGIVDVSNPYALRLMRPTGIIEHEVIFMSTNTSTSRVRYLYEGTNLLKNLKAKLPDHDWIYAGADAYGERANSKGQSKAMSLGVYTSHGESESCWTNMMQQTPGKVNVTADGELQLIDPNYFEPPSGTNLWIYADIDPGSVNSLSMVIGDVTNTSAVIIVPQSADGTFSTSIVYVVKKWFEMDKVVTNEYGKTGGSVKLPDGIKDERVWSLDLSGLKMSDPENRKFEVVASVKDSSKIAELGDKGITKDDPYYPAVVDWLQNYDEGDIKLAEFWLLNNTPYRPDGVNKYLLNLKQMYWLNIDPVGRDNGDGNSEWALKGGMSSGAYPVLAVTNSLTGSCATNIRCAVTLMITNLLDGAKTRAPDMLRGLEPGSTSSNYNEKVSGDWNSVTFKITGALQNGKVNNIYRPLRWFTFGPDSFSSENGYTRVVDIMDPFSKGSPGYSYEWYKHPGSQIFYRWAINHDTNRPPITVYQLNDDNALLEPR